MRIGNASFFTIVFLSGMLVLGALTCAHASYIDVGSASYLFQLAIAGVFGAIYSWRRALWGLFRKSVSRQPATTPPANPQRSEEHTTE